MRYKSKIPQMLPYTSGVYMIKCLSTNKVYIGSAKSIRRRLRVHLHHLRHNKHHSVHLQRAWDKYGEQDFEWCVLDECPLEDKILWEQQYMDLYKSANRDYGYNMNPRADGQTDRKWTPEQRLRQSISKIGTKCSEESKQRRREAWIIHGEEWIKQSQEQRGVSYDFISPTGQRFTGKGVGALAKEWNVDRATFSRLAHHKINRTRDGWRRYESN